MTPGAWMLVLLIFSTICASLAILWWAKEDGQFDDVEGIKYRMLKDD
ncbi:cbb3-type cytochrome oxidase assembly protein [Heliorestis acidaminivorans]|nr:cbb3-type cytochrome oxidase assembly protein [Heliorestis acidaminivorans]